MSEHPWIAFLVHPTRGLSKSFGYASSREEAEGYFRRHWVGYRIAKLHKGTKQEIEQMIAGQRDPSRYSIKDTPRADRLHHHAGGVIGWFPARESHLASAEGWRQSAEAPTTDKKLAREFKRRAKLHERRAGSKSLAKKSLNTLRAALWKAWPKEYKGTGEGHRFIRVVDKDGNGETLPLAALDEKLMLHLLHPARRDPSSRSRGTAYNPWVKELGGPNAVAFSHLPVNSKFHFPKHPELILVKVTVTKYKDPNGHKFSTGAGTAVVPIQDPSLLHPARRDPSSHSRGAAYWEIVGPGGGTMLDSYGMLAMYPSRSRAKEELAKMTTRGVRIVKKYNPAPRRDPRKR